MMTKLVGEVYYGSGCQIAVLEYEDQAEDLDFSTPWSFTTRKALELVGSWIKNNSKVNLKEEEWFDGIRNNTLRTLSDQFNISQRLLSNAFAIYELG